MVFSPQCQWLLVSAIAPPPSLPVFGLWDFIASVMEATRTGIDTFGEEEKVRENKLNSHPFA